MGKLASLSFTVKEEEGTASHWHIILYDHKETSDELAFLGKCRQHRWG